MENVEYSAQYHWPSVRYLPTSSLTENVEYSAQYHWPSVRYLPTSSLMENVEYSAQYHWPSVRYLPTSSLMENVEYSAQYHWPSVRYLPTSSLMENVEYSAQYHWPSADTYQPHHWWRTSSTQPSTTDRQYAGSTDIHSHDTNNTSATRCSSWNSYIFSRITFRSTDSVSTFCWKGQVR